MIDTVVTREKFPAGVMCARCKREILPGRRFINRDDVTGALSTGPCTEDRWDGVFHESC